MTPGLPAEVLGLLLFVAVVVAARSAVRAVRAMRRRQLDKAFRSLTPRTPHWTATVSTEPEARPWP